MLTATPRAIECARALCRQVSDVDDALAEQQLVAFVRAGKPLESLDPKEGTPQAFVWLSVDDCLEPWGAAIVKGRLIVTVLRPGAARVKIKAVRQLAKGLVREDAESATVLLRYRSEGVPGVLAVEVMRDGTARYVTTAPAGGQEPAS